MSPDALQDLVLCNSQVNIRVFF